MLSNLLLFRLIIVNTCGAVALAYAYQRGFVGMVFEADSSRICYAIAALFAVGMISVFQRALKVSTAMNAIKAGKRPDIDGIKFMAKGDHITDIAQWLAVLGLIGTIVGFIAALSGISADMKPEALIGQLISGMAVAFFTTLAGAITGLWLEICNRILRTASVSMVVDAK